MILQIFGMTIKQMMMAKERGMKLKDLDMPPLDDRFKKFEKTFEFFAEESPTSVADVFTSYVDAIDGVIKIENKGRKISELPEDKLFG